MLSGYSVGLLGDVAAGRRAQRRVLAVAEGGACLPLVAGAGDQPFRPRPPPRALLHTGRLEPLVGIVRRGRPIPALIAHAVRRVDNRLDVAGADEGHLLVTAADQVSRVVAG